jgi:hypothetical protein
MDLLTTEISKTTSSTISSTIISAHTHHVDQEVKAYDVILKLIKPLKPVELLEKREERSLLYECSILMGNK